MQNGTSALAIAKRLGYISVIDVLKLVTEDTVTMVSYLAKLPCSHVQYTLVFLHLWTLLNLPN